MNLSQKFIQTQVLMLRQHKHLYLIMKKFLKEMMMVMQTKEKYSNERLNLRKQCLSILLKKYEITTESKYSLRDIYECAEEWTLKYKTSNGVVDYFKAYFSHENQKNSKEINQVS